MGVIFEAVIKVDEELNWYIQLTDTTDDRTHKCLDMAEFSAQVEIFGADYGGRIDEVKWSKDENVPPQTMDEIRMIMAKEQEEIKKLKAEAEASN